MPELTDLHDAFARLEQQIPDGYRSPVVQDRLARLQHPGGAGAARPRGSRPRAVTAALLAAAAVAALAVTVTVVRGAPTGTAPAGTRPSQGRSSSTAAPSSHPATRDPGASSTPPRAPSTGSTAPGGAVPPGASALLGFVRGGRQVSDSDYQRGAARVGQPMQPTPGATEFTMPSGNISCGILGTGGTASLVCEVARHSWDAPPRPATCGLNWAPGALTVTGGTVRRGLCLGGPPFAPVSTALPYGSSLRHATFACRSDPAFLACADLATGHGFAVSRGTLRTY